MKSTTDEELYSLLAKVEEAKNNFKKTVAEAEKKNVSERQAFVWVSTVLSLTTVVLSLIVTAGQSLSNIIPAIGWILSHNFFTDIWNAATPDGKLEFIGTIIVAVPGLTIVKALLGKDKS